MLGLEGEVLLIGHVLVVKVVGFGEEGHLVVVCLDREHRSCVDFFVCVRGITDVRVWCKSCIVKELPPGVSVVRHAEARVYIRLFVPDAGDRRCKERWVIGRKEPMAE